MLLLLANRTSQALQLNQSGTLQIYPLAKVLNPRGEALLGYEMPLAFYLDWRARRPPWLHHNMHLIQT